MEESDTPSSIRYPSVYIQLYTTVMMRTPPGRTISIPITNKPFIYLLQNHLLLLNQEQVLNLLPLIPKNCRQRLAVYHLPVKFHQIAVWMSLVCRIKNPGDFNALESNGTKMLEQEYNDKVFECVQKFLSLDQTIDKLIGDMREGFPVSRTNYHRKNSVQSVVEQITKYYIKILTEKLTGIIEQTISKLGLDRNKEFFETCTDVKDYSAESVFWNYLCSMSDNGLVFILLKTLCL